MVVNTGSSVLGSKLLNDKTISTHVKAKHKKDNNETTETEETESDSSESSEEEDSDTSSTSSTSSDTHDDDASAEKVIKKTVIRSTDPSPTSPTALLRTIQGSNLFKSNTVAPTSTSQTQSLAISKSLPGDLQKVTANKKAEIQPNTGTTTTEQQQQSTTTPRSGRRRRRRALTICLAHCRYDIVRKTSEKFGLVEVSEDQPWNIYWTDYSVSLERAVEMRRYQIVNHFPGMNEICRKDLLARNLNRMRRNFPQEYDIYPMSWCLPADGNELATYSQTRKGKTYICKPEMGCQGRGIFLVKNVKDLNPFGRIICQVYIQKPFLIDLLKFDLRIYVLITSCDPLRIWVYKEGLARKLTTVYQWLKDRDYNVDKLKSEIDDIIIKTILSAHPILKHHYRTCFPHHDICSACFELLGFDILLDHKLKPFVIEVNHSPSFHMDTNLDREIKEELLHDTVSMLNVKQLERRKIENEDRRRVQIRLANKVADMKNKANVNANKASGDGLKPGEKVKDDKTIPTKLAPEDAQFKWENDNSGGYRLIYPLPDSEKYDKFLDQNICSIYQETAASQARANLTRTQLDEYNQKKRNDEKKRPAANVGKDEKLRPESPSKTVTRKSVSTAVNKDGSSMLNRPVHNSFSSLSLDFGLGNKTPAGAPIITKEEYDRAKCLMQRGMLIRSLGIELQVYNLLSQVGSLKPTEHEEFRRKHGFAISQPGIYQRIATATTASSSSTGSKPPHTAMPQVLTMGPSIYTKNIYSNPKTTILPLHVLK
ncbi:Tubulin polyglutamylase ttll6 [Orchesella cincta]|uniref:Tubulin polyglutamylase ttll6 n=1 Tax=Orchesella cincta TaxID=48709 RepID=A0A1D2NE82_ORCCI|nr:Tubulin polyglutamylase ttll6 [Orchesella cincta]